MYAKRKQILWLVFAVSYLVIVLGFTSAVRAGTDDWQVFYEENDLSAAAAPLPAGDGTLINVTNVGPILGITVIPEASSFVFQTSDGTRWIWESGSAVISSPGQQIPLTMPAIQQGLSLFIPPDVVAEMTHLALTEDKSTKRITFGRPGAVQYHSAAEDGIGDGWQAFTIAKPKVKQTQNQNEYRAGIASLVPPPKMDRLNLTLGVGHVQHADWGAELGASGRIAGGDLNFRASITNGDLGARVRNTYLNWIDREAGISYEAGDLYSESWGLVRGLRYSWRKASNRWPSLGLYLKTDRTDNPHNALCYSDDLTLTPDLRVRAEIATDKSSYASASYEKDGLGLFAYQRNLPDSFGKSEGAYTSIAILPRVSVFLGVNSSTNERGETYRSETMGLRLPLFDRCNLILDQSRRMNNRGVYKSNSVGVTVPVMRSMNLFVRYQRHTSDIDVFAGRFINVETSVNSLISSLTLFADPRVTLDYQMGVYSQSGARTHYEQLVTNMRLSPRTSLQTVSGFPNIADKNLLRLRLDHQLGNDISLVINYGRLSPYQSSDDITGKRGLSIMIHKKWPLSVPARGGTVEGVVVDQIGEPVESITIQLGQYSTVSDKDGHYSFEGVPSGAYKISISDKSIPADYKVENSGSEIKVVRDKKQSVDFTLVPLGCITGRVYLDKNGNNKFDPGEEVPDVAMYANDNVTSTGRDGRFGFYNLDPGQHTVRVAAELLDKKYTVQGPAAIEVKLEPRESITNLEFRLKEQKKPIIFMSMD